MKKLVLLIPLMASAQTLTTVTETPFRDQNGANWRGTVEVSPSALACSLTQGPSTYGLTRRRICIGVTGGSCNETQTAGTFTIALVPTIGATPTGCSYNVKFSPASGPSYTQQWVVPESGTALAIRDVRVVQFPPNQATIRPLQIDASDQPDGCAQFASGTLSSTGVACGTGGGGGGGGGVGDPGANGIMTRTALNTTTARTLTAGSNRVTISNGNGVSGNPTIDVAQGNLSINWNQILSPPAFLTGNQTITISGDASGSGATAINLTLGNTAVTPGSYTYPSLTIDAKGRVTAAANGTTPLLPANNLSDLASASTARSNLGLGSAATQASSAFAASSTTITAGTGLTGGGDLSANRSIALSINGGVAQACPGTDKASGISPAGILVCTADQTGAGGSGITTLNGLTATTQSFSVGTSGTDFNIVSNTATHTLNIPTASGTNRGLMSPTDWNTFNNKANINSPAFTGTPTAPTPPAGDASTRLATTDFVDAAMANISGTSPISVAQVGQNVTVAIAQSGATNGQVLKWNGSAWAPAADDTGSGGTITLNGAITGSGTGTITTAFNTSGATSGQVLTFNGSTVVWQTPSGGGGCSAGNLTCSTSGSTTTSLVSSAAEFFIRQTGDVNLTSRIGVINRGGGNGAYIENENSSLNLVDLSLRYANASNDPFFNLRYEARGGANTTSGQQRELQFAFVNPTSFLPTRLMTIASNGIWLESGLSIQMRGASAGTFTFRPPDTVTSYTLRPPGTTGTVGQCLSVAAVASGVQDIGYTSCGGGGGGAPAGSAAELQYRLDATNFGAIPSSYNATTRTLTFSFGSVLGLTASTEAPGLVWNGASRQFATGNFANQRGVQFNAPTVSFLNSSTITNAATVYISGPTGISTNAEITNNHGLWIDGAPETNARWQLLKLGQTALASPGGGGTVIGYNGPSMSGSGFFLDFQNAGARSFAVTPGGTIQMAGGTSIRSLAAANTTGNLLTIDNVNARTATTSATTATLRVGGNGITSTSGTMAYRTMVISDTFNQTGTATGATAGLVLEPTVTSAALFTNLDLRPFTNNIRSGEAPGAITNARIGQMTAARATAYTLAQNSSLEIAIPTASVITADVAAGLTVLGSTIANTTEGYGAIINAPTGATRNFALRLNGMLVFGNLNFGDTSGTESKFDFSPNLTTSSGNYTAGMARFGGTINQTGTASGIIRTLLVDPTYTSCVDCRAFEVAAVTQNIKSGDTPSLLRSVVLGAPTFARGTNYTLTNAVNLDVVVPTVTTINATNSTGIRVAGSSVSSNIVQAHGAWFSAPSGATRNFALRLSGMTLFDNTPGGRPVCDSTLRGAMAFVHGDGSTTSDTLSVCYINAAGVAGWKEIVP